MENKNAEMQAKVYVYDLNNCAKENGFKADEGWELSLANDEEKLAIEKRYYPTIATKVLPEILLELFRVVKSKLMQAKYDVTRKIIDNNQSAHSNNMQYLVAYNPKRPR